MVGHPGEKVGHCLAFPQELGRWGGGGVEGGGHINYT